MHAGYLSGPRRAGTSIRDEDEDLTFELELELEMEAASRRARPALGVTRRSTMRHLPPAIRIGNGGAGRRVSRGGRI